MEKGLAPAGGLAPTEWRATISLASIFFLRMLGLFMVLPVFALYAEELQNNTPLLTGLAIGVYGLTQAILQIPFGLASDRVGRKPVIIFGLLLFAFGSVVAANALTIEGVIIGRALQGSGAIAAAVMALAADLTREEQRSKAMAVIGASIGLAFMVALMAGPILAESIGVDGIFWLTGALALGGIIVVLWWVPSPVKIRVHRDAESVPGELLNMLQDGQLLRLDVGILTLHMILTAVFVVVPLSLRDVAGIAAEQHWSIYLPVLLFSFVVMLPFMIHAERRRKIKPVFLGAIAGLVVALLGLTWSQQHIGMIVIFLFVFFVAFNLLEAMLPSLVSKIAPPASKGSAMGVYSSSQFFGAFLGGVGGGWIHGQYGVSAVFLGAAGMAAVWLGVAASMRTPRHLSSYLLNIGQRSEREAEHLVVELTRVKGVAEAVVIAQDGIAYLKVDRHALDVAELQRFSV